MCLYRFRVDGLVLQSALLGIVCRGQRACFRAGTGIVIAQAGEDWDSFVEYCVERALAGSNV